MSFVIAIDITCDICYGHIDIQCESEDDANDEFENYQEGRLNVEVSGVNYEHVCEGCMGEMSICSWCEDGEYVHSDDTCYCNDLTIPFDHETCRDEMHRNMIEDGIGQFDEGSCEECGWEHTAKLYQPKSLKPTLLLYT